MKHTYLVAGLLICSGSPLMAQQNRIFNRNADIEKTTGKAPDYSKLDHWAAHPGKRDYSDSIPAFLKGEKRTDAVDVFYIHPTTFTKNSVGSAWNADTDNIQLNDDTDKRPVLYQASVFNGSRKVYAPRYRQAHLKAFFLQNRALAKQALDLAYDDVRTAFQYYLDHNNSGRPIIIASHSQGSYHAIRLLQEFFDGKPLRKQLVCAYVVGWQIKKDDLKSIPAGGTPTQTGCIVGWRSFEQGFTGAEVKTEKGNSVCVNPVSWTMSDSIANKSAHKGGIAADFNTLMPNAVSAQIDPATKILWVILPDVVAGLLGGMHNYHILDYNLFYMDIRENVKSRVEAYLKKQ